MAFFNKKNLKENKEDTSTNSSFIFESDMNLNDLEIKSILTESIGNEIADDRYKFFFSKEPFIDLIFPKADEPDIDEEEEDSDEDKKKKEKKEKKLLKEREKINEDLVMNLREIAIRQKMGQMVRRMSKNGIGYIRAFKFENSSQISLTVPYQVIWSKNVNTGEITEARCMYFETYGTKRIVKTEFFTKTFLTVSYEDMDGTLLTHEEFKKETNSVPVKSQKNPYGFVPVVEILNEDTQDLGAIPRNDLYNCDYELSFLAINTSRIGFYLSYYQPQILALTDPGDAGSVQQKMIDLKTSMKSGFNTQNYKYGAILNGQVDGATTFIDVSVEQIKYVIDVGVTLLHQVFEKAKTTTSIDGTGKAQKNDLAIRQNRQALELFLQTTQTKINEVGNKLMKIIQKQVNWIPNDLKMNFLCNVYKYRNEIAESQMLLNEFKEFKDPVSYMQQKHDIPEFLAKQKVAEAILNIETFADFAQVAKNDELTKTNGGGGKGDDFTKEKNKKAKPEPEGDE